MGESHKYHVKFKKTDAAQKDLYCIISFIESSKTRKNPQ